MLAPAIYTTIELSQAVDELLARGWTKLRHEQLARGFDDLVPDFIRMTQDERRADYIITDVRELDRDGEPDLGLIENAKGQLKPNPRADEIAENRIRFDTTKFKHQYKPRAFGYVGERPGAIERQARFYLNNAKIYGMATLLTMRIAELLDERMPGFNFLARLREADHLHLLRLLRYLCDGPPEIARPHRDQNFITVQIGSDRSGLWLVDNDGQIIQDACETDPECVLVFLSRKAWQMTRGKLQGVIHGVKDVTYGSSSVRTPRHAAVYFGHVLESADDRTFLERHVDALAFPSQVKAYAATA